MKKHPHFHFHPPPPHPTPFANGSVKTFKTIINYPKRSIFNFRNKWAVATSPTSILLPQVIY